MISYADIDKKFGKSYEQFKHIVSEYGMLDKFKSGVAVGLSGGADSVFLLLCMKFLSERHSFPLCAIHVNHGIRGEEADRDEKFCRDLCSGLAVKFFSCFADVPCIAKEKGIGLEEAARNVRYAFFDKVLENEKDYSYVVTAHNATDNAETLIFNTFRGGGISAICGIPITRGNILRPLIAIKKKDILNSLTENDIEYVTDSTNKDTNYTRNFIRQEILPLVEKLNPSYCEAVRRLNSNASADSEFIEKQVDLFCGENNILESADRNCFVGLDYAIMSRVVVRMYKASLSGICDADLEYTHIKKICSLINSNKIFSYDIPNSMTFCGERDKLYVRKKSLAPQKTEYNAELHLGQNFIPECDGFIYLTEDKNDPSIAKFINVYKLSIQATFVFDTICGKVFMRNRKDGDSYRYGNMTHKLKKLYNDAKLSAEEKNHRPVICDDEGILWVPGFKVREGNASKGQSGNSKKIYALYCYNGGKNA